MAAATMALRFRDLSTPLGGTIDRHLEIINRAQHVWWALPQERIPRDTFARFLESARASDGLEIFLVDSGQLKLYKANLKDMQISQTNDPIQSPESVNTPSYYIARSCRAWFKLVRIVPCAELEINSYSYCEEDGTIKDPTSSFFAGKKVFNLKEMLDRVHRTLYFLLPFNPATDRENEVILTSEVQPANFIIEPINRPSNYIVHVSDLHFGEGHGYQLTGDEGPNSRTCASLLVEDLKTLRMEAPAALLISGDMTWQGGPDEFQNAQKSIANMTTLLGLDPRKHLVMVPGNHDVRWAEQTTGDYNKSKPVTYPPPAAFTLRFSSPILCKSKREAARDPRLPATFLRSSV